MFLISIAHTYGTAIIGVAGSFDSISITILELKTVEMGLVLADKINRKKAFIVTDSMIVLYYLTGYTTPTWDSKNLVRRIREHMGRMDDCVIRFNFRVTNGAADFLAGLRASELEIEAYPLLDELTSKISTLNLERVRRLKSRLVALTRRVQKVRDEIEQLMDDDGDMAEMYLTEKKRRTELCFYGDQSLLGHTSTGGGISVSAPVSPVASPPNGRKLEKSFSVARSRHESTRSSNTANENIEELEMLFEAYFVVIDNTLNKLTSLKEYIDDTEDFINIQLVHISSPPPPYLQIALVFLFVCVSYEENEAMQAITCLVTKFCLLLKSDNVRNQLIQFELLLTTATFVVAIFGVVAGIFGMNFSVPFFDEPSAFKWVLMITGICGVVIFGSFLGFFKYRRLMPL
ncbi:hypothetical protein GIB67_034667 [Kingdonia uniflora]|uniref:Magnesium transporter n=1 Tax=Kingdonia uniflora TaxID=39325 RepID=A0A7J7P053_9MAGN|nr:hypothetical protein GIB67_034667 [Kingdonia uniflora]